MYQTSIDQQWMLLARTCYSMMKETRTTVKFIVTKLLIKNYRSSPSSTRHTFSTFLKSYIADSTRTVTSNDYFDVKRCRTCGYTITEMLVGFNKEIEFETKYPFWVIVSSFNGSHDTLDLFLSDAKHFNIQFCQCSWHLINKEKESYYLIKTCHQRVCV